MEYQIIELANETAETTGGVVVRRFESAYRAMEELRAAIVRGEPRAQWWYLVDGAGRILVRPDDVYDLAA